MLYTARALFGVAVPLVCLLAAFACNQTPIPDPGSGDGSAQNGDTGGGSGEGGVAGTGEDGVVPTGGEAGDGGTGASGQPIVTDSPLTAGDVKAMAVAKLTTPDPGIPLWRVQLGVETQMIDIGRRFATMPFAAAAGDWGTALNDYEEIEYLAATATLVQPERGPAFTTFVKDVLEPLADALRLRDLAGFSDRLPAAIASCNSCHVANSRGFITVQPAATLPRELLLLGRSDPIGPYHPPVYERPTAPLADTHLLGWADLNALIDFYLTTPDLTLPLWVRQRDSGPVMLEYGLRFALMKFAVDAGDWALAQYQCAKAIQAQEADEIREPERKPYFKTFEYQYLTGVKYYLDHQDADGFNASYQEALPGCNACHVSAGHWYIRVGLPYDQPQPILALASSEPRTVQMPVQPAEVSWPDTVPNWQDALNLLTVRMSRPDASLPLWKAQRSTGNIMMQCGYRFSVAWFAAENGSWSMVEYQLASIENLYEAVKVVGPEHAAALDAFTQQQMPPLRAAVYATDKPSFAAAFSQAAAACNACHAASGRDFIRVQIPVRNPADYLKF